MSERVCDLCGEPRPARSQRWCSVKCRNAATKRRLRRDPVNRERHRESARAWKNANREANRARDRERSRAIDVRGTCLSCGNPMGIAYREDGTCESCRHDVVVARWEQIEKWWADGLLLREIADRLGFTMGHLAVEIDRMRKAGRAVPYRYAACERKAAA